MDYVSKIVWPWPDFGDGKGVAYYTSWTAKKMPKCIEDGSTNG